MSEFIIKNLHKAKAVLRIAQCAGFEASASLIGPNGVVCTNQDSVAMMDYVGIPGREEAWHIKAEHESSTLTEALHRLVHTFLQES